MGNVYIVKLLIVYLLYGLTFKQVDIINERKLYVINSNLNLET